MSTDASSPSQPPNFPSRVPPPTGNIVYDSLQASFVADICPEAITYVGNTISQSAKHVTELPCARNALLAGIVSGAGMGVIRGMAAGKRSCEFACLCQYSTRFFEGPMIAGNWAVGTFALISLGSWCI